jgi:hypothetical protein
MDDGADVIHAPESRPKHGRYEQPARKQRGRTSRKTVIVMTKKTTQLILEVASTDLQKVQQVTFTADAESAFTNFREGRYLDDGKHLAVRTRVVGQDDHDAKSSDANGRSCDVNGGPPMEASMGGQPQHMHIFNTAPAVSAPKTPVSPQPLPEVYPCGIRKDDLLDGRTEKIIGCYSMRLMRTSIFQAFEQEDVKQDFRVLLLNKMLGYAPDKGDRYSYTGMIVVNGFKNMLKMRDRREKKTEGIVSLQDNAEGCDKAFGKFLAIDDYMDMVSGGMVPAARKAFFEEALQDFLDSLDELDRRICEAIMEYGNAERASKHTGIPARTILYHLRNSIFEKALEAGLDEFFGGAR